jgi:hypothetical protein
MSDITYMKMVCDYVRAIERIGCVEVNEELGQ